VGAYTTLKLRFLIHCTTAIILITGAHLDSDGNMELLVSGMWKPEIVDTEAITQFQQELVSFQEAESIVQQSRKRKADMTPESVIALLTPSPKKPAIGSPVSA
jgi:hypothetical protein